MAIDLHVVGRIKEGAVDLRALADNGFKKRLVATVAAADPVLALGWLRKPAARLCWCITLKSWVTGKRLQRTGAALSPCAMPRGSCCL
ncbi:hypothetical protein [Erythrobacter sp. QSSC1-22B]|uniref:hypothetical protein n=1 Tax=Erythrobacter sp. QSSC1-22B TaxID=1860125 RepID=UPI0018F89BDE|nr:hypothetical protein [Erythrobacter sp. QSSC1-22B]